MVFASHPPRSLSIFTSYAPDDEQLWKKLEKHLSPLKQSGLIKSWDVRKIMPGAEWATEIHTHLHSAQIILLLVSPDFITSDVCSVEMEQAIARHRKREARVIPIVLRPIYWQITPLGNLQPLPANGKPVTTWTNYDEAFHHITLNIGYVISEMIAQSTPLADREERLDGWDASTNKSAEFYKAHAIKAHLIELQQNLSEENVYYIRNDGFEPIKQRLHYSRDNISELKTMHFAKLCFKSVDRAIAYVENAIMEAETSLVLLDQLMAEKNTYNDITQLASGVKRFYKFLHDCFTWIAQAVEEFTI